jgi:hypothetical protein
MNNERIRLENDTAALGALHKYGWLRAQELGRFLWPTTTVPLKIKPQKGEKPLPALAGGEVRNTTTNGHAQACRAAKLWVKRGLMVARKLPDQSGTAYVLAAKGIEMLWESGIKAKLGTSIGSFDKDKKWIPPDTWKHDLLAAGVLIRLANDPDVIAVYAEKEIRRSVRSLAKTPDGLVLFKAGKVVWVEVEQSKKTDPVKTRLLGLALSNAAIENIETVYVKPFDRKEPFQGDDSPPLVEVKANAAMVIFDVASKHDHKSNVTRLIACESTADVEICWAACSTARSGVMNVEYTSGVVKSDRAARIGRTLTAGAVVKAKADPADVDELEGNYNEIHWEIHKGDMSVHIDGIEKGSGFSSLNATKTARNRFVLEADQARQKANAPRLNSANHGAAVAVAKVKQQVAVAKSNGPVFKNIPLEQRTYKGTLYILQSESFPRSYQVHHNERLVAQNLTTLEAAREAMMKYFRDCQKALEG